MIHELRVYQAVPGQMAKLQARFRDHLPPDGDRCGCSRYSLGRTARRPRQDPYQGEQLSKSLHAYHVEADLPRGCDKRVVGHVLEISPSCGTGAREHVERGRFARRSRLQGR